MRVSVRLFAILKERAGTSRLDLEFDGDSASPQEILDAVRAARPVLAPLLPMVRLAVNEAFAQPTDAVKAGDDLALIPPVSGGSGVDRAHIDSLFRIYDRPIELSEVVRAVERPGAGALVTFSGTVRDATQGHSVTALEYEAYGSMAERTLSLIGAEVAERWPGTRTAIIHRTGHLKVGEPAVHIAVSSPHRADAFDGCRHAIERLKQDVPIWKKEFRADGTLWVGMGS